MRLRCSPREVKKLASAMTITHSVVDTGMIQSVTSMASVARNGRNSTTDAKTAKLSNTKPSTILRALLRHGARSSGGKRTANDASAKPGRSYKKTSMKIESGTNSQSGNGARL